MGQETEQKKSKCTICKHAVFDELWGEYKCRMFNRRVANAGKWRKCEYFEKGVPTTSAYSNEEI